MQPHLYRFASAQLQRRSPTTTRCSPVSLIGRPLPPSLVRRVRDIHIDDGQPPHSQKHLRTLAFGRPASNSGAGTAAADCAIMKRFAIKSFPQGSARLGSKLGQL